MALIQNFGANNIFLSTKIMIINIATNNVIIISLQVYTFFLLTIFCACMSKKAVQIIISISPHVYTCII